MLAYIPWLLGSKSYSPPNLGGVQANMGPRGANLHPERRPFWSPNVPELAWDLHHATVRSDVKAMLAFYLGFWAPRAGMLKLNWLMVGFAVIFW